MISLHELFELNTLALEKNRRFLKKRRAFSALNTQHGKHFIGIVGPRGVGKSVLLRQLCHEQGDRGLYISLDSVTDLDVFETVKRAVLDYGVSHFFLDEVHFVKTIDQQLKKIHDFLDVRVTFSSSVAVAMHKSSSDLSRRMRLFRLGAFQYGEYLDFTERGVFRDLTFDDLLRQTWESSHLRTGAFFHDFLQGGLMPYRLEEPNWQPLQRNILDKILEKDLPSVNRMTMEDVFICRKMVEYVGKAQIDGVSYSSLARNLGITKYKAEIFVGLLEKAFVLHRVMPTGTNVLREPKILMCCPYRQLFSEFQDSIGGTREDFTADMLSMGGFPCHYLKSTRGQKTPDYLVHVPFPLAIEVGGRGKGREQFKGIKVERKLILADGDAIASNKIPLFLLGFLPPSMQ